MRLLNRGSHILTPLQALFETKRGRVMPLPPELARLYGPLRFALKRARPYVISNFVTTLDGVVSLNVKGHMGGGAISGCSAQDRLVMGLLRTVADVVIVGAGTLRADPDHVWTAEYIFPDRADDYRRLRVALGKPTSPLNVIVSGSGRLDLSLPVFASGTVPTLVVTTTAGHRRLRKQETPESVRIRAVRGRSRITPRSILEQVHRINAGKLILVEGGPRLLGDFYAARVLDEQFLTLAPQIAGRKTGDRRLSLAMEQAFAPRSPRWGALIDLRRGGSHLFLRYAILKN